MVLNIVEVADRPTLAMDPDADFQPWTGIAADGNTLRFTRMRSAQRRSWCAIDGANQLVSRRQGGGSWNGHFPTPGELVISTNHSPGRPFKLNFDNPVTGVGLDVEPAPGAIVPGQAFKVTLEVSDTSTGETVTIEKAGNIGACCFVGARCDVNRINQMVVRAFMVDGVGQETPVDFAVNRLELLAPVGNIV